MFNEQQLKRYADVLMWGMKTARVQDYGPEDIVLLRFDRAGIPLAEVIYDRLVGQGIHPVQRLSPTPSMEHSFFAKAGEEQLVFDIPGEMELYKSLNGSMSLLAPESLTHLRDVDPSRIGMSAVSRKKYRDVLDLREGRGEFGWTLCLLPTEELARNAGISFSEYRDQIVRACYLDTEDPIAQWEGIYERAGAIKDRLNALDVSALTVESENCDLRVTPGEQRRWIGVSGHNIPSFELFFSPDWRGTSGVFFADQPSFRSGNYVRGVRLEFEKGVAVGVQAEEGEDFVRKQLAMDEGANRLGEFSLTDRRFSRIDTFMAHTLFDENFGGEHGNCHIAVGASYADTYTGDPAKLNADKKRDLGVNDSALHWDLVNTEQKRVTAELTDGSRTVIYENGEFVV
ncbi:MAG: aminopeptidase [Desulfohalobiaceae bacterium]